MEEIKSPNSSRKKKIALILAVVVLIALAGLGLYLHYQSSHVSTDDAFVDGRVHTIAAKIAGTVRAVHVNDNQFVRKGDLLVEIAPEDYDAKLQEGRSGLSSETAKVIQAGARIEAARRQLLELEAQRDAVRANLDLRRAQLSQAERDLKRAEALFQEEIIPKERHEQTATARDVALAQTRAAEEQLRQAGAAVEAQRSVIREAEAAGTTQGYEVGRQEAKLRQAELNVGYTRIFAPADGYVTKKSVEVGNQIQPSQPLMAVAALGDIWITANYKETQLEKVRPGQRVSVKVDTYPGREFSGRVDSLMAGTGSVFSLFPPENATGNFVKVVQRVPVKIVLDRDSDTSRVLRVGMSVVPTIIIPR